MVESNNNDYRARAREVLAAEDAKKSSGTRTAGATPAKNTAAPTEPGTKPRKKKKKSPYNNISYMFFILGVSFLLSGFLLLTANDVLALIKPEKEIIINFEEPLKPSQMAKVLRKNGVIQFPWAFSLYANLKDYKSFEPGKFEMDASMDYGQILAALARVSTFRETTPVTIPEGYTLAQIAQLMEDSLVCSKADFLETAATYPYKHEFLKEMPMTENRLEGYLYPDTYEFYKNDKPVSVINKMLNNFNSKYFDEVSTMAKEKGMTTQEVLTIASMIEREAVLETEQRTISGVIHNRLKNSKNFPFLNIDATVQYALGKHKQALTTEDLKVDSPYNTYVYKGLPPGPICNPGMGAIVSAINPESHKYYYYVATGEESGSHIFSKTLDEHNAARASVKK